MRLIRIVGLSLLLLGLLFSFKTSMVRAEENASFDNRQILFEGGVGGYHTYRIPALLACDDKTLLVFCEGRKNNGGDAGDIDLLMRKSIDGGKTWEPQRIIHEEGDSELITIGNPCPILDLSTGVVHLLFSRNNQRAFHMSSSDQGTTWTRPQEITDSISKKEFAWKRIATGPVHGIQIQEGVNAGRLVAPSWLNLNSGKKKTYRACVFYSDDKGKSWQASQPIKNEVEGFNECSVANCLDGSLVLLMRTTEIRKKGISISKDQGETWSEAIYLPFETPVCQSSIDSRLNKQSGTQTLVLSTPTGKGNKRTDLALFLSNQATSGWTKACLIKKGPAGYSDLALVSESKIYSVFEGGDKNYSENIYFVQINLPSQATE